jgi:hypothetical protein
MPAEFGSSDNSFPPRRPGFGPEWPPSESVEDEALWDLLSAYMDGEATPEEAAQAEALLQEDPAVARDFEFLRMTSVSARSWVEVEPPAALREAIFAATSHRRTLAQRVVVGWSELRYTLASGVGRYALPAGALAAAGLAALLLWPRHPSPLPAVGTPPQAPSNWVASNRSSSSTQKRERRASAGRTPKNRASAFQMANAVRTQTHRNRLEAPNGSRMQVAANRGETSRIKLIPAGLRSRDNRWRFPKPGVHHPIINEKTDPVAQVAAYEPRPGMDVINQRSAWVKASDTIHDSALTDGTEVTPEAVSGPNSGAANPSAVAKGSGDTPKAPRPSSGLTGRIGHLLREQLPPDPRLILTNAELKRRREAATLGYDHDTLEGIQRGQATVALISGKF